MEGFEASRFAAATDEQRAELCAALARALTDALSDQDFRPTVARLVEALRAVGHDLCRHDEDDDLSIWGGDHVRPKGPGILITFRPGRAEVTWSPLRATTVYLVTHSYETDDGTPEMKHIGVYSSEIAAHGTVRRLRQQPGFRDHPDGFHVGLYVLDRTHWEGGFFDPDDPDEQP